GRRTVRPGSHGHRWHGTVYMDFQFASSWIDAIAKRFDHRHTHGAGPVLHTVPGYRYRIIDSRFDNRDRYLIRLFGWTLDHHSTGYDSGSRGCELFAVVCGHGRSSALQLDSDVWSITPGPHVVPVGSDFRPAPDRGELHLHHPVKRQRREHREPEFLA